MNITPISLFVLLVTLALASALFGWLSWNVRFKVLAPMVLGSGSALGLLIWVFSSGVPLGQILGVFCGALVGWSFFEYLMHRYLFHYRGPRGVLAPLIYDLHESHHDRPQHVGLQPTSMVVAFPVSVLMGLSLVQNFGLIGATVMAGLLIGYVYYEWSHYAAHNITATYPYARWQQRLHRYHHHREDGRNFGVTSPLWDWVFGTLVVPQRSTPAQSASATLSQKPGL